ncbi:MAG: hypothetical protein CMJ18_15865 [Phycisphaeraceae bacterium]|nr:hypothetical protein [Phycisphaeraceae bacterium]
MSPEPSVSVGHPAVRLLVLAGPVIATNLSRPAMSLVDFLMVKQLGTEAMAAIVPARMVVFCLIAFGLGLVSAVNTFVAQALGRGDDSDCAAYAWQGIYLSLVAGVVLIPGWWLIDPLFQATAHGPDVVPLEIAYTKVSLYGMGPSIAAAAIGNFFIGIHRPSVNLVAVLVSNVFNVVANYALIFGNFGFPALGMTGAAWATLAACVLQVAILFAWILLPRYHERYATRSTWRLDLRKLWRLVRIGTPAGVHLGVDFATWTFFTIVLVGRFGHIELAANNICFTILEPSYMPAVGLGMALTSSVGRCIGAGRVDLARRYVRWGLIFNVCYMGSLGILMAVFRNELAAFFSSPDDPESAAVVAAASPLLIMAAIFQGFDGMAITFNRSLAGAGDTLWPATLFVISAVLVLAGGGYLSVVQFPQWKAMGPWLAGTIHLIVIALLLAGRYYHGKWERINIEGDAGEGR